MLRGAVLAIVLLAGCASSSQASRPPALAAARVRARAPSPARRASEPPVAAPTVHPCQHARRCCHAFIEAAMPPGSPRPTDVGQACDAMAELEAGGAADACKQAMQAWRTAFGALGQPIASACGGP